MLSSIIPLKTVFFQTFFLLIQITIEALFFYKFIKISRKKSLEYSIPVNLFSNIIGWLIFFVFVPLANSEFQFQLMNFILFNKLPPNPEWLILTFFIVVFALALTLKITTFMLMERISKYSDELETPTQKKYRHLSLYQIKYRKKYQVIIWGHSLSHGIILLILILVNWNSK
ncbi:filament integrity protein FraC [Planktothricoides sp. SR001]|uniref:filament integrity protein FraC n=1 Tax=Planktothricoides sp. SR001 TaxID=1705388 RepID=UPI0006C86BA4|nr:filament integrity protein FraC [Planktothricoides sp. SR001]